MSDYEPSGASDPILLICPNGHTTWTTMDDHYWCHECSQLHNVDPEFDQLHDPKTGDPVTGTRVNLP